MEIIGSIVTGWSFPLVYCFCSDLVSADNKVSVIISSLCIFNLKSQDQYQGLQLSFWHTLLVYSWANGVYTHDTNSHKIFFCVGNIFLLLFI